MKVIHDGDAAYEDIMALCLLLLNADVVAVTVAYGESTTKIGAENMERVCRMLKPTAKIPVAYGVNSAMDHHGTPFPEYITKEANTILNDTDVPLVTDSQVTDSAVKLIYDTLMSSDEKITLVATGPLTNIAQLISAHPDCIEKIEKIVIMGGAVKVPGNISDLIPNTENTQAEWNFYADPKAAERVFTTPNLSIWLVPIDITCQMPMTRTFIARLDKETLPALKLVKDMLTSLLRGMGEELFYGKLQFWDSLSAMIALNPLMALFEPLQLTVDLSTSQTKIDKTPSSKMAHVQVATKIYDVEGAYDAFFRLMKTGTEPSMRISDYNRTFFGLSKPVVFSQKSLAPEIQQTNTLT
ncbi:nucleoside hydrolase [Legionella anisa]|uniref:Nucleoside hydrolase n=1 Tax=Legionella anisa TaxID=28082 RepID=A0AAX0WVR9_9GAMM|nr:nucleoside hydrolase [Legionella anisa]AWN73502.1 nucleoside hydrolase [Legionella anisa]KTC70807.1 inosine-uridine preferring nucleoside hydrolase [Legionella anisa]MBN5935354.1 nucleoside hydrolase [Legionella anisa]MCW8426377.1 nucleoside hydrolase [Legionella anisa]MCW8448037.1 nucleoside hydrolase [Legionella anisa]